MNEPRPTGAPSGANSVGVVVLAAGRGVRFGGDVPKPLLQFGGASLLHHALDAATSSGVGPVAVVVSDDRVAAAVPARVEVLRNDAPGVRDRVEPPGRAARR